MAFPAVQTENGGNSGTDVTSHTVNLPSGIVSGDLLIAIFVVDNNPTITWPSSPDDWTQLYIANDPNDFSRTEVRFRRADGTEGASITVTTSASEGSAHTTYRISGHHTTTDPEAGIAVSGDSATPDPPSLSPSWGDEDTLWFAITGYNRGTASVTAYPASYTNGRNDRWNNNSGVGAGSARRDLNAASDDPGTFTLSAGRRHTANTIAIRPTAAVAVAIRDIISSGIIPFAR